MKLILLLAVSLVWFGVGRYVGYNAGCIVGAKVAEDAVKTVSGSCRIEMKKMADACFQAISDQAVQSGMPRAEVDRIVRRATERY